ncbi:Alpha-1,3 glucan synthase [Pseudozyma hubeiensis]|nr:Alpha-1,3 glucan synthase [Pseudozyma hubeiensis]
MKLSIGTIIAIAIIVLSRTEVVQAWGAPSMAHVQGCQAYTKLLPRYDLYSKHCESASGPGGSDPKWPCFTMWYSDMSIVNATLDGNSKVQPDDHFLIKNGDKLGKHPLSSFFLFQP